MSTLTKPQVANVLRELYEDARASTEQLHAMMEQLTPEQRALRTSDAQFDYRAFYGKAREIHMPVSEQTGTLLYMLARSNGARNIIEFGTSYGLSTLHLAAALRDNGGGRVIGSDFEPTKITHARRNLERAGLADLVEIRDGDALETLARDLPAQIDGVLLDGHKPLYARVLALLAPRLRVGAFVVADNADACPDYVRQVRATGSGYVSVPFGEDVELTVRC